MNEVKTQNPPRTIKIIYGFVFASIVLILFAKCPYGFPSDEALYLLIPERFIKGDIPILHEWHPTQISNIWLTPLVSLVVKVNGGISGLFLIFRYIFTFFWCITSAFLYVRLRKINHIGAMFASLIFMVYVPFGEMALYYNTIALMTLSSSLVILITSEKHIAVQMFFSGFLLALAVTCCPFLAPLFILLIIYIKERTYRLSFTGGTATATVIFFSICLAKASPSKLIQSIKHLANDREHPLSFFSKSTSFFSEILSSNPITAIVIALFIILVLFIHHKSDEKYIKTGFVFMIVLTFFLQISFLLMNDYINFYMFAPGLIGFYCYANSRDEIISSMFRICFVPGIIYSFAIHFSSNLGFYAIASACTINVLISCVMAARFLIVKEMQKPIIAIALAFATFQFGIILYKRVDYVFVDSDISKMTETCTIGSMKGLKLSENDLTYYKLMLYDTLPISNSDYDRVLLLSTESWLYLDIDKKIGSYTCWTPIVDEYTIELLDEYYALYPEMKPDAIYVESKYSSLVSILNEWGYQSKKTELGGCILTKIETDEKE